MHPPVRDDEGKEIYCGIAWEIGGKQYVQCVRLIDCRACESFGLSKACHRVAMVNRALRQTESSEGQNAGLQIG